MTDRNYLTIGELARRVGVTVRTIQYYDQQGLLSPSAKGPQNQRLYTDDNVKDLYRILTLKYLGLSLAQIKSDAALYREPAALQELADEQMDAIEEQFQSLFKRMTTLRSLHDESLDDASVNWEAMADTIERCQGESQFFWRLTCIRDDAPASEEAAENQVARGESVSKWHELIADTIRLMPAGEPVDSERNRELAKRYLELDMEQDTARAEQNFILMENIAPVSYTHLDVYKRQADESANIIYGQIIDEGMQDQVRITVIATGFKMGSSQQSSMDFSRKDLFASTTAPDPMPSAPPVTFSTTSRDGRFADEDYIPDFLKRQR